LDYLFGTYGVAPIIIIIIIIETNLFITKLLLFPTVTSLKTKEMNIAYQLVGTGGLRKQQQQQSKPFYLNLKIPRYDLARVNWAIVIHKKHTHIADRIGVRGLQKMSWGFAWCIFGIRSLPQPS
ncbi:hypothetical protein ACJX0J_030035, partial [Zea mays]